jgi:hypothetical protein
LSGDFLAVGFESEVARIVENHLSRRNIPAMRFRVGRNEERIVLTLVASSGG